MNHTRTEKIREIIRQRHARLANLEPRQKELSSIKKAVSNLKAVAKKLRLDDEAKAAQLQSIIEKATLIETLQLKEWETLLQCLEKRYRRDTLNIGIVGTPKQGKSSFLVSLTGLDSTIIPTGNSYVTGATSYFRYLDNPAQETYAEIEFYSRENFMDEVIKPYLETLHLPLISSPEDLRNLAIPEEGYDATASKKRDLLKGIISHLDEFSGSLGKDKERITKNEIRNYVAQCDVNGREIYTWHAVRRATIFCHYPQDDLGDIMVCDTPGLGDFSAGASEKLKTTLHEDMDIVIMMKKIDETCCEITPADTDFINTLEESDSNYRIGDWAYIIINKVGDFAAFADFGSKVKKELRCPNCVELHANDAGEVTERFSEMLDEIVFKVAKLDNLKIQEYDNRKQELKSVIADLVEQSKALTKGMGNKTTDELVNDLAENSYVKTFTELQNLEERRCSRFYDLKTGESSLTKSGHVISLNLRYR